MRKGSKQDRLFEGIICQRENYIGLLEISQRNNLGSVRALLEKFHVEYKMYPSDIAKLLSKVRVFVNDSTIRNWLKLMGVYNGGMQGGTKHKRRAESVVIIDKVFTEMRMTT